MTKNEIMGLFKKLSASGALMGHESMDLADPDLPPKPNLIVDNFELLHFKGDVFWLLFRFMEYHYGDREIRQIKVIDITKYSSGYVLRTKDMLFYVERLNEKAKQHNRWKKWVETKEKYKDLFHLLDEYSFKEHLHSVLENNKLSYDYGCSFSNVRNDIWERINKERGN